MFRQLAAGLLAEVNEAHILGAGVEQMVGAGHPFVLHPADDVLHPRQFGVGHPVGDEVDAGQQGAGVDPLQPGVPAFHRRRVQDGLAHIGGFLADVQHAGIRVLKEAHHPQGAGDHFGGALDLLEAGVLEPLRQEHMPQHGLYVKAGVLKHLAHFVQGVLVPGRLDGPRGNLRLVRHKEVVQVAADEAGGGRLLEDDVDDVLAVKVAGFAQEGLFPEVVVFLAVGELPRVAAVGRAGQLGLNRPAGEGARALPHIHLGVVGNAHGEQLQELPAPVLVHGVPVVLVVVQPENHGRVLGQLNEHIPVVAHPTLPEHIDLLQQLVAVVHLGVAGGENMVPEQRHLFLQGTVAGDHVVHPVGLPGEGHAAGQQETGVIAEQQRHLAALALRGRVQQFLYGGFVALGNAAFQLGAVGAEPGAPHQVGHQCQVILV